MSELHDLIKKLKEKSLKPDKEGNMRFCAATGNWIPPYEDTWLGGYKPVGAPPKF